VRFRGSHLLFTRSDLLSRGRIFFQAVGIVLEGRVSSREVGFAFEKSRPLFEGPDLWVEGSNLLLRRSHLLFRRSHLPSKPSRLLSSGRFCFYAGAAAFTRSPQLSRGRIGF